MNKELPDTTGESLCFITIGYAVEAFVDGERIYTFGSSLDGDDVWGVKTHIIQNSRRHRTAENCKLVVCDQSSREYRGV